MMTILTMRRRRLKLSPQPSLLLRKKSLQMMTVMMMMKRKLNPRPSQLLRRSPQMMMTATVTKRRTKRSLQLLQSLMRAVTTAMIAATRRRKRLLSINLNPLPLRSLNQN